MPRYEVKYTLRSRNQEGLTSKSSDGGTKKNERTIKLSNIKNQYFYLKFYLYKNMRTNKMQVELTFLLLLFRIF